MSNSSKPIPLAVPNALLAQIDAAAQHLHSSRSEAMRLAIQVGLADLKRTQYQVAECVVKCAHARASELPLAAETPTSPIPTAQAPQERPPKLRYPRKP
jgi:hypothetical protein